MSSDCAERNWQSAFVTMLPELERRLRRNFRGLDPASRDEAIAEGVAHCVSAYVRLHESGRTKVAGPSTLVWYAVLQVKRGRPAAGRVNGKEPLSRYAQIGNNAIRVDDAAWIETLVDNTRWDVADQVASRIDIRAWFATLSRRMKQIARDLAYGYTTSEVAAKYGVSASRISQMRRMLEESWSDFEGQGALAIAG